MTNSSSITNVVQNFATLEIISRQGGFVETKCFSCGSVNGGFRSFVSNQTRGLMYYWICTCGCNYSHAETEDEAFMKWRQHCKESPKTITQQA